MKRTGDQVPLLPFDGVMCVIKTLEGAKCVIKTLEGVIMSSRHWKV